MQVNSTVSVFVCVCNVSCETVRCTEPLCRCQLGRPCPRLQTRVATGPYLDVRAFCAPAWQNSYIHRDVIFPLPVVSPSLESIEVGQEGDDGEENLTELSVARSVTESWAFADIVFRDCKVMDHAANGRNQPDLLL